jgi:hypothetical protein
MIPNAGNDIVIRAPSLGPIDDVVVICVFGKS